MEHPQNTQIKVGLFVFTSIFLAAITIFFLGGRNQLFKRQYHLKTQFSDISGLRVGAQVQLAGLPIGMVDQIYFSDALEAKRVVVILSLDKSYQDQIRENSIVTINNQGLLGDKVISVSPGTPDKRLLEDGEFLTTLETQGLSELMGKGGEVVENVSKASRALASILEEVEHGDGLIHALVYNDNGKNMSGAANQMMAELRDASTELKNVLQKVNRGEGTIGALLSDSGLYQDLRRLFGKLERNALLRHVIRSRIRDLELESEAKNSSSEDESPSASKKVLKK